MTHLSSIYIHCVLPNCLGIDDIYYSPVVRMKQKNTLIAKAICPDTHGQYNGIELSNVIDLNNYNANVGSQTVVAPFTQVKSVPRNRP